LCKRIWPVNLFGMLVLCSAETARPRQSVASTHEGRV
jgi:hypothetical protein